MTVPDPEDPDRRAQADDRDATTTDARFAEIVAGWSSDAPRWPEDGERAATDEPAAGVEPGAPQDVGDDHYVPPEPPPLPTLRPRTIGGLLALAAGLLLLLAPGVIDLSEGAATPLGLLTLAGAVGWLALGLRSGPPSDSGWDDGAQL